MANWNPPMSGEEFAEEIEDANPVKVAQLFEDELDRAHRQGYKKARDKFICRAYSLELGSQRDVGKAADVSSETVSRVLRENGVETRPVPDIFKK